MTIMTNNKEPIVPINFNELSPLKKTLASIKFCLNSFEYKISPNGGLRYLLKLMLFPLLIFVILKIFFKTDFLQSILTTIIIIVLFIICYIGYKLINKKVIKHKKTIIKTKEEEE